MFVCSDGSYSSSQHRQCRGVPQGCILSPLLFNLFLRSVPLHPDIVTLVYADDIAFLASASSPRALQALLQHYLDTLNSWLLSLGLSINAGKSAILSFLWRTPASVSYELLLGNSALPQVPKLKYLGIWYDASYSLSAHVTYIASRATRALNFLASFSNTRSGLRRPVLLHIYKMYVRPILEFGCPIFSSRPQTQLRPLLLLERRALRFCLGVPITTPISHLYAVSGFIPLSSRFNTLTLRCILLLFSSQHFLRVAFRVTSIASFRALRWTPRIYPQLAFAERLFLQLYAMPVSLSRLIPSPAAPAPDISIRVVPLSNPGRANLPPPAVLSALLDSHVSSLSSHLAIFTDGSVVNEKAGIGFFIPSMGVRRSIRLPDYIPIYFAELVAVLMALQAVPSSHSLVCFFTDSLSLVSKLDSGISSHERDLLLAFSPSFIHEIVLTWVPGHCGLPANEVADSLARAAVASTHLAVLPLIPTVLYAMYKRFDSLHRAAALQQQLRARPELAHLEFGWNPLLCGSRRMEVLLTRFRCRVIQLNYYLHRIRRSVSPLCPYCQQDETIEHFFLHCSRYSSQRAMFLAVPLRAHDVPLSASSILSFGRFHFIHLILSSLHVTVINWALMSRSVANCPVLCATAEKDEEEEEEEVSRFSLNARII
ncbi:uncharacterized protein LOC135373307 [Ornithodoros turicata]|uniref:uncharacterized protein LOC135373307 n=1 Tax=Ornithodoros turicata TaxID=34597 RepID=UPI0031394048